MVVNKQLSKILYSSTTTLSVWAILSRIAYAEGNENALSDVPSNSINEGTISTVNLINEHIQPLQKQIIALTNKINSSNINLPDIFGLPIDTAIYILLGIATIALLLAILGLACLKDLSKRYLSKFDKQQSKLTDLEKRIAELENHIIKLNKNIIDNTKQQKSIIDPNKIHSTNSDIQKSIEINSSSIKKEGPSNTKTKEQLDSEQHQELENIWKPFIQKYNDLSSNKTSSYKSRDAFKQFYQQNNIEFFNCINSEARLSFPYLATEFKTVPTSIGSYLALPLKNSLYAVVPNLKDAYEYHLHETAGMKEVFESNYEKGSYNKIIVKRPAIFDYTNDIWTLKKRGEIKLSN